MKNTVIVLAVSVLAALIPAEGLCAYSRQESLMAYRAARLDAYRRFSERISGLRIDSETTVSDLAAENDEIGARLENFLRGADMTGLYYNSVDGLYEISMEMTIKKIVDEFKVIQERSRWADRFDLDLISRHTEDRVIAVQGYGAIPGSRGQAMLRARRAAILDAYRNLAEEIYGLRISGSTYVRDFVLEDDYIRSGLHAFLKGTRIVSTDWDRDGSCRVEVEVTIRQVVARLKDLHRHRYSAHQDWRFGDIETFTRDKVISAEGVGLPGEDVEDSWAAFFAVPDPAGYRRDNVIVTERILTD